MSNRLVVSDIKLPINHDISDILKKLYKEGISVDADNISIIKKSIDARDKVNINYVYTIGVDGNFTKTKKLSNKCSYREIETYQMPKHGEYKADNRHVIIGAGPAGLFAGLILARGGYKPLIIERGDKVEDRTKAVNELWNKNILDEESNLCFGEGGAGAYSDGKLNTGVKLTKGRMDFVLNEFVRAGADESVKYWYRPHVGTDKLETVIKNIRNEIISLGGEFLYRTKLVDFTSGKSLTLKLLSEGKFSEIKAETAILATGHSARDIYTLLNNRGAIMSFKPFAVGVRIEHPQEQIQLAQYGTLDKTYLPVADYKLTHKASNNKGVYSFCMCPGGYVVNSSTDAEKICVNGMSLSSRDGINANSAIIATVDNKDFGDDLFGGVRFQEKLEEIAYKKGDGAIPVQLLKDFKKGQLSKGLENVSACIKGSYSFGKVNEIFNSNITNALIEGIDAFSTKLKDYNRDDAVISGVESRTSSPIRIFRDENFESNIKGIFPCGEGAGYAGGITSSAMDGIKVAEEIIRRYKP